MWRVCVYKFYSPSSYHRTGREFFTTARRRHRHRFLQQYHRRSLGAVRLFNHNAHARRCCNNILSDRDGRAGDISYFGVYTAAYTYIFCTLPRVENEEEEKKNARSASCCVGSTILKIYFFRLCRGVAMTFIIIIVIVI